VKAPPIFYLFSCNFAKHNVSLPLSRDDNDMRTLQEYIDIINTNSPKIMKDFGVKTLRIFGSVSRNEQTANSDLDVCVETTTPNPFLLADLKEYLENLLTCPVDVIRVHKNMNQLLRRRIDKEGQYAIR